MTAPIKPMQPWQRAIAVAQLMRILGCDVRRSSFTRTGLICTTHSAVVDKKNGCAAAIEKAEKVAAFANTSLRRNQKEKNHGE